MKKIYKSPSVVFCETIIHTSLMGHSFDEIDVKKRDGISFDYKEEDAEEEEFIKEENNSYFNLW